MSYTLIDHDLTPYSALEEIDGWLERVKGLMKERPDDDGLRLALQDIERIRKLKKRRMLTLTSMRIYRRGPRAQRP